MAQHPDWSPLIVGILFTNQRSDNIDMKPTKAERDKERKRRLREESHDDPVLAADAKEKRTREDALRIALAAAGKVAIGRFFFLGMRKRSKKFKTLYDHPHIVS